MVLVGDQTQLEPTVVSEEPRLKVSLSARLLDAGAPYAMCALPNYYQILRPCQNLPREEKQLLRNENENRLQMRATVLAILGTQILLT